MSVRSRRVARFALGVSLAAALSFGLEWPMVFLAPVFTALFLSLRKSGLTLPEMLLNGLYAVLAAMTAVGFSIFLSPFPLLYVPALGFILFQVYHRLNRGDSPWPAVIVLLSMLVLPTFGASRDLLESDFALWFTVSALCALALVFLSHLLLPEPETALAQGPRETATESSDTRRDALRSAIAILPLAILFIESGWNGQLLVLIYAAIFALSPELSDSVTAGFKALAATVIGGLAAWIFIRITGTVPQFPYFVALMLLATALFGIGIFSGHPYGRYLPSATVAFLILLGSSTGADVTIEHEFLVRVALISLAIVYVTAVMLVLDRLPSIPQDKSRHD